MLVAETEPEEVNDTPADLDCTGDTEWDALPVADVDRLPVTLPDCVPARVVPTAVTLPVAVLLRVTLDVALTVLA